MCIIISVAACGGSSPAAATPTPPLTVYEPGNGVSQPRLVKEVKPNYTAAAIGARIQGTVLLSAVVLPDGTVGEVTVLRSLDNEVRVGRSGGDCREAMAVRAWHEGRHSGCGEGRDRDVLHVQLMTTAIAVKVSALAQFARAVPVFKRRLAMRAVERIPSFGREQHAVRRPAIGQRAVTFRAQQSGSRYLRISCLLRASRFHGSLLRGAS